MKRTLLLLLTMLLCTSALAQTNNLEVLWESEPGFRPAGLVLGDGNTLGNVTRWDATGDGKPDLIMTREDEEGNLRDLLIRDGATNEPFWRVEDVSTTLGLGNIFVQLWGFADVNGDGEQEALFTTETELYAFNPSSNESAFTLSRGGRGLQFLGAIDLTGDSHEEIVANPLDAGVVIVWTWTE